MAEWLVAKDERTGEMQPIFSRNNRILTGLDASKTVFDEVNVAEFTPEIGLDSTNGLSLLLRDKVTTAGSGTVTESNGEFALGTGTTSASSAVLLTREHGRYQSGIVAVGGLAFRVGTPPTANEEYIWGYFDDTDGFWFGEDATGIFIRYRHNGTTEDKVYQTNWNGEDRLDGTGPSGVTLDTSRVAIYRINYTAYGAGPVEFRVLAVQSDGTNTIRTVHKLGAPDGEALISQWKLQLRAEVANNSSGRDITGYVGGRQFSVLGRFVPQRRLTSQEFIGKSITTSYRPLVTFKKRSGAKNQHKSVSLQEVDIISDADAIFAVVVGGSVGGTAASFVIPDNVASTETCLLANTAASAISLTGSTAIFKTPAAGASGVNAAKTQDADISIDLPDDLEITLVAKTVSGAGTVSGVLSLSEAW